MSLSGWMAEFRKSQKTSAKISRSGSALKIGKGGFVSGIKWQGLDKVLENLNLEAAKIGVASVNNLLTAGLLIKGKAQRIVPVDTANLKASAYVVWGGGGSDVELAPPEGDEGIFKGDDKSKLNSSHNSTISRMKAPSKNPFVVIGFTAFYALFVHEDLTASHVKTAITTTPGKKTGSFADPRRVTRTGPTNVQIGQAKYLEQPFLENKSQILSILKREI